MLSSSIRVNLGVASESLSHFKFTLDSWIGITGFLERKEKGTTSITITCQKFTIYSRLVQYVAHYFDPRYTAYSRLRTACILFSLKVRCSDKERAVG